MNRTKRSIVIAAAMMTLSVGVPYSVHAQTNSGAVNVGKLPTVAQALPIPPSNFDPLTATANQLKEYGFPKIPINPNQLATWKYAMSHAKYYVAPQQSPSTTTHGLYNTTYSSNWAGYLVKGGTNGSDTYNNTSAQWVQPSYTGTADPSFWVGQGYTSDIVQAGADSNASSAGGSTQYEFWVEDYPNGTIWQKSPVLYKNDTVYVDVTYGGSTSSAFLENVSTGYYTTVSFNTPYFYGNSADYVNEAVGSSYNNWTSWGSTNFSQCDLNWDNTNGTSGGGQFNSYNDTKTIMTSNGASSGTVETQPGNINNSTDGFSLTAQ